MCNLQLVIKNSKCYLAVLSSAGILYFSRRRRDDSAQLELLYGLWERSNQSGKDKTVEIWITNIQIRIYRNITGIWIPTVFRRKKLFSQTRPVWNKLLRDHYVWSRKFVYQMFPLFRCSLFRFPLHFNHSKILIIYAIVPWLTTCK